MSRVRKRLSDPPTDPVLEYAKAVIAGTEVAGPHVIAACKRHVRDLEEGRGLTWDLKAAKRAIGFFRDVLKLSEGQFEGKPFLLHPAQQFIVGSIFGWKKPNEKGELVRRFRRAYIEMAKGNGKSPMAGGIGLYGMAADSEPGAEIYSAGANKDQAKVLFNDAVKMAKQSPALDKRITYSGKSNVYNMAMLGAPQNGSFFRPVSRETRKRGSGPRPHMALCDEIHEHPDGHTIGILEAGFKFRRQPLLLMLTNSGSDRNSVCWAQHDRAVKVAHGDIEDDSTFSYVCALDEKDDPLADPTCWKKANPLLGSVVTEAYLAGRVKDALDIPAQQNEILRLHFCVWTDAQTAWISRKAWDECEDASLRIEDFHGRRCHAGLDLSATKDITAKVLVFEDGHTEPDENGKTKPKFVAFAHGYTPKDTLLAREELDKAPYSTWVRQGFLTATPGPVIRYDFVAAGLVEDSQTFDLVEVAYDRFLIKHFEDALTELGAELPLREHGQGPGQRKGCPPDCDKRHVHVPAPLWMPQSVTELEKLILERRIRFHINPALRSAVASAQFRESAFGQRIFEKQKATGRIDLAVALAMAVGSAVNAVGSEPSSGYINPDLAVLVI